MPRPFAPFLVPSASNFSGLVVRWTRAICSGALIAASGVSAAGADSPAKVAATVSTAAVLENYCFDCHGAGVKKGGLMLDELDPGDPTVDAGVWEKVIRKLAHRQMPPVGEPRPDEAAYAQVVAQLVAPLDAAAHAQPRPGRTESLRRLNRTEYQNAIRDLLGLEIDATALLPHDEPSHGFDNVIVGTLSPTLLDRYVSAAQKIARLAVGTPRTVPDGDTYRLPPDVTQEEHVAGLPLGTRGGAIFRHTFPQDGEYEVRVRLMRDRNEQVEGLRRPHDVEVLLDRERVGLATVHPPGDDKNADVIDAHLQFRFAVQAGPHDLGVTFLKDPSVLVETERQPFLVRFNVHRHPRTAPALYQVSIVGPFDAVGAGDTPSRRAIFGEHLAAVAGLARPELVEGAEAGPGLVHSAGSGQATPATEQLVRDILAPLMRRAYRRPVTDEDLRKPLEFFQAGCADDGSFDAGIERAISAVLVSPRFLFRVEQDPDDVAPGTVYRVSDLELASRLSFFLWSSLPDDALLAAAERGELREPPVYEAHVRRMLADERARNLVTNFAAQWLHLRGLESVTPDLRLFIDFDDNLRQALRQETELFFESVLREDRPVTDLLEANYTFLNERLAKHYGIPHIYGSHFRRVALSDDAARQRGGLLRQGSILTVTSYATRTSPVIRGKWILDNFLGTPPPPPPADVPALDNGTVSENLPVRQRLAAHRANPQCASCHDIMDPVGFALENYDAIGRWRTEEAHLPIDASGGLPDGTACDGVADLEQALLQRPELFAGTVVEKLLIFALGRGLEPTDAPAVRAILRRAETEEYRFSSLMLGIVNSPPFQMRTAP